MNEVLMAEDEPRQPSHEAPAEAGALLREAREAAGLRIEVLAASLKVPVAKLVALEGGDLSALPDRVFVRALVSSICRHLKVAPEPILAKLPPTTRVERPVGGAAAGLTSVRLDQGRQSPLVQEWMSRPLMWGVLLLLLGAVVIIFWPQVRGWGGQFLASPSSAPEVVVPAASVVTPVQALPLASAALPEPVMAAPPASTPVPAVAAVSTAEWLVLQAKGEAWVRVTDAQNVVVLQKTMLAGEVANVTARPPLSVVIGRADAVDVRVHGKPMDLSSSGGKVVRFVAQ
jgi:cytoskeleton protein RodZ